MQDQEEGRSDSGPPDCCSPRRITLRKLLLALSVSITVMICAKSTTAQAESSRTTMQDQIHQQLVIYYHTSGYIKAIGANAHRTIYSSNPRIRHRWRGAVRYLNHVKRAAERRLTVLRAPPPQQHTASTSGFPPHHALWVCIGRFEGGVNSVNPNGHYGMLQMHADWGYGTSHHASDDSQQVQEWAAERAYKASGYSSSFLYGQWLNYDGASSCLSYR